MILSENFGDLQDMATQHMLAPVFLTPYASVALAAGDLFIYQNELYKATAAIAQNAAINFGSGGNATAAGTLAEELYHKKTGSYEDISGDFISGTAGTIDMACIAETPSGIIYLSLNFTNASDMSTGGSLRILNCETSRIYKDIYFSIGAQFHYGMVEVFYKNSPAHKGCVATLAFSSSGSVSLLNNSGDTIPANSQIVGTIVFGAK